MIYIKVFAFILLLLVVNVDSRKLHRRQVCRRKPGVSKIPITLDCSLCPGGGSATTDSCESVQKELERVTSEKVTLEGTVQSLKESLEKALNNVSCSDLVADADHRVAAAETGRKTAESALKKVQQELKDAQEQIQQLKKQLEGDKGVNKPVETQLNVTALAKTFEEIQKEAVRTASARQWIASTFKNDTNFQQVLSEMAPAIEAIQKTASGVDSKTITVKDVLEKIHTVQKHAVTIDTQIRKIKSIKINHPQLFTSNTSIATVLIESSARKFKILSEHATFLANPTNKDDHLKSLFDQTKSTGHLLVGVQITILSSLNKLKIQQDGFNLKSEITKITKAQLAISESVASFSTANISSKVKSIEDQMKNLTTSYKTFSTVIARIKDDQSAMGSLTDLGLILEDMDLLLQKIKFTANLQ